MCQNLTAIGYLPQHRVQEARQMELQPGDVQLASTARRSSLHSLRRLLHLHSKPR
jgi:hypothetical protein